MMKKKNKETADKRKSKIKGLNMKPIAHSPNLYLFCGQDFEK